MNCRKIAAFLLSVLLALTVIPFGSLSVAAATSSSGITAQISAKSDHTPLATGKYYQYSSLNATQKKAYNAIVKGIAEAKNAIDIASYKLSQSDAFLLIQKVLADHPEYFYVSKEFSVTSDSKSEKVKEAVLLYTDGKNTDTTDKTTYKPVAKANRKTISQQIEALNKKTSEILAKISTNDSQLVKEKAIHDYLTANIRYNDAAVQNPASASAHVWDIYGALIEGSSVCEGYAKSFVYLCHLVGINATTITGYANGDHMWNAVEIDKSWYLVDVTWDDDDEKELTIYQYFNITSKEMGANHFPYTELAYPNCTATKNSYKTLCINLEKNTLPSNYKSIIDNVIKNKEAYLPLYIGTDGKIDTSLISKLFINSNSSVQKYINTKGYKVTINSTQVIQYGYYMLLVLQYPNCGNNHKWKTTTTKATTSENGSIVKECTVCGKVASSTTIKYAKTFTLSTTTYTYDGKVKTPSVTVKDAAGNVLKKDTDYKVTYASGRKNAGTYKVTVTMMGNYSGTKTLTFKINPINVSKCSVKLSATSYTYDGKVKTPTVTVKNASGTTLTKNTHYTVTYASGRKNVGTYKVTIKGKGNYTGTKTLTFKIDPAKTTVSKVTSATKSLKVSITKKATQVTGYQVQYSTSKAFTSAKSKTLTKNTTTSTTLTGLKAKTTYYVRVRTYKTVNGVKYYSGWSTVKSAKTK